MPDDDNMDGFIYIMSNPDMPGLVKVGMTKNDPTNRATELTTTGVPQRFVVEYYAKVNNRYYAEKCAHSRLGNFHHHKEFFKVDIGIAIYCLETISQPTEKIFSRPGNDQKVADYKRQKAKAEKDEFRKELSILQERKRKQQKTEWIEDKFHKAGLEV